jgi:hypothetical protein
MPAPAAPPPGTNFVLSATTTTRIATRTSQQRSIRKTKQVDFEAEIDEPSTTVLRWSIKVVFDALHPAHPWFNEELRAASVTEKRSLTSIMYTLESPQPCPGPLKTESTHSSADDSSLRTAIILHFKITTHGRIYKIDITVHCTGHGGIRWTHLI